jgi:hypothetical protein
MNGRISISRWTSNKAPFNGIRITVVDEKSGTHFIEVDVSPENFANALFAMSEQECEFELRGMDNVGKTREQKTVPIIFPTDDLFVATNPERDRVLDRHLRDEEVDGWIALRHTISRRHGVKCSDTAHMVNVTFVRFV